jgi:hypothetical protein
VIAQVVGINALTVHGGGLLPGMGLKGFGTGGGASGLDGSGAFNVGANGGNAVANTGCGGGMTGGSVGAGQTRNFNGGNGADGIAIIQWWE